MPELCKWNMKCANADPDQHLSRSINTVLGLSIAADVAPDTA